ncbi:MAG: hypothetical protein COT92_01940 [Candidatus Doudnabacteria bacterium CG10_big_fil_rev_8_21_14_0_10_42_18]|uniref:DUF4157 domain-containing protein n=1 Tax=Candidatus Doudnabacteria bacterium CG10_big_fil_rev_8_21_14_0_10_42_18 TaxID=1974552 RepID=A0A2H0VB41_9BACT|nr:MAG: hypothetical protein COT92_01940 [Candidatus Doudnabacteria bacterium CG10_big_fil_rev_8_21_14_0_10_42_18]
MSQNKFVSMLGLLLNAPWTLLGLAIAALSIPKRTLVKKDALALVIDVRRIWLVEPFHGKPVKGFTLGNCVLRSDFAIINTINHELIHVRQFTKFPLVFPFLYLFDSIKKWSR